MSTALFVLTSHDQLGDTGRSTGWYLPEAAHPWKVLAEAGWDIRFTSPLGGRPAMDGGDLSDPVQAEFLSVFGPEGPETATPDTINPADIDAIVYVGGHGTMWDFPDNTDIQELAREVWHRDGIVAAMCHGPAGLVNLTTREGTFLVDGRRVAAFTDAEEAAAGLTEIVPFLLASTLASRGALHVPADNWANNVVVDGRLITGQNPASAESLARAILEAASHAVDE